MERFDIEQSSWRPAIAPAPKSTSFVGHWQDGSRFISLRKYSTAICLIEALTILFLVYLLVRLPPADGPPTSNNLQYSGNVSNTHQPYRTYYSNSLGLSVTVLPSLAPHCNQRRHDLSQSVVCKSSSIAGCGILADLDDARSKNSNPFPDQPIEIITTSKEGRRLESRKVTAARVACGSPACQFKTRVVVNRVLMHQKIIGWGGAMSDSSINNILGLTVNATQMLLDDYFADDGLAFNMVRVTIGGSDFSARFYTNDDAERYDDPEAHLLKHFELTDEDRLYKIPMLQRLLRKYRGRDGAERLKLFASMWSPPVWMKTNNHFNKGQLRGSITDRSFFRPRSDEQFYEALADLKMKWLLAYEKQQVNFWGLTVMNEPIFAVQPFLGFNTMIFPRDDYANYVARFLGPKLRGNSLTKKIKLMVHDDNRRFLLNFTKPILDQSRVRQFINGVSVHGYIDQEYDQMDYMYEHYRKLNLSLPLRRVQVDGDWFVLPTELCSGHLPFMEKALVGNWHRGIHYALDIINSLQHSAAGWVDWNMVLDTEGGPGWLGGRLDAPIIVDKARDLYHKSPMYYVLGQFSRYIPPDSERVDTELVNGHYDSHFETVTFKTPPGGLTTVVVNNNPYPVKFLLQADMDENGDPVYYELISPADSVTTIRH